MAIKNRLTCMTYIPERCETMRAVRLDSYSGFNQICNGSKHRYISFGRLIEDTQDYLVGEIADRLYEYEQLGYTPDELRSILMYYKVRKAGDGDIVRDGLRDGLKSVYITAGRQNGKTELQRRIYEYLYIENDIAAAQKRYDEWIISQRRPNNPKTPKISMVGHHSAGSSLAQCAHLVAPRGISLRQ